MIIVKLLQDEINLKEQKKIDYKRVLEEQIEHKKKAKLFEVHREKEEDLKYEMKMKKQIHEISAENDIPIPSEGKISL